MSSKFLYSRSGLAVIVILALSAVVVPRSAAQGQPQLKRPNNAPEERPAEPKKKKVKGPRAVGILQLTGGGKSTLVPVAILVDGRFYDASAYKADPVPMALEGGTVYEAEQAGESQGLFTIKGALHSKNPGSANPWVGTGAYQAHGAEAPKSSRKAENVPVGLGLDTSDEPPRLTRGSASKAGADPSKGSTPTGPDSSGKAGSSAPTSSAPTTSTSTPPSGASGGGSSGQDGAKSTTAPAPDRGADEGAKEQAPAAQKSAGTSGSGGQAPPDQKASGQASTGQGEADQTAGNYYRPTLRRGKPTQAAPDEMEAAPKVEKPGSPATARGAAATESVQLVPAISDAGGPEPQSYKFFWKEGEEDERRKQMLELAASEVQAYVTARAKGEIPAKPAAKTGVATHKSAAKPAQPLFENIQFRAFDVWRNNQPVMILSAEGHFSAPHSGPTAATTTAPEIYSVTLVTRTDIYGNLRKLYSGVTDKFHLDVTPRLELIDVVDADGDGRGELLFRETTDAGSGYLIYRATGDKLWKMFDSLGG
jgi:hypothetical protein